MTLLGPSGCGKTTLLNLVAGFLMPDSGEIGIDGRRVTDVPAYRREIGIMFQNYALFPHMSVTANVGYGLKMRRLAKPEIARRVGDALALGKPARLEDRQPPPPSRGQPAARRPRLRPRHPSQGAAAGRAVLRARPQSARLDASRTQEDSTQARRNHHLRHP